MYRQITKIPNAQSHSPLKTLGVVATFAFLALSLAGCVYYPGYGGGYGGGGAAYYAPPVYGSFNFGGGGYHGHDDD